MGMIGRLVKSIRHLLAEEYPSRIELPAPDGGTATFEVASSVECYRVEEYGGEKEVLQRFLGDLRSDDVVYDVGASVGLMTVMAAKAVQSGRVVAFEPDPETRQRLTRNIQLNDLSNVEVIDWAASESEGTAQLHTNGAAGFAPSLRRQVREGAPSSELEVRTRRIDSAVEEGNLPIPTVMKIDVEGAEGLCLRGARELLSGRFGARPRLIYLELHPDFLPDFGDTAERVEALLTDLGYEESWRSQREDQTHVRYLSESEEG